MRSIIGLTTKPCESPNNRFERSLVMASVVQREERMRYRVRCTKEEVMIDITQVRWTPAQSRVAQPNR